MELNARQKQFIVEYLIDKNATQAAIRAGYSKATATTTGPRLLDHVGVLAEIEKGLASQRSKVKARATRAAMTKERWIRELEILALSNMDEYAIVKSQKLNPEDDFDDRTYETVHFMATNKRPKHLGRAIKKIAQTKHGLSIELHSKQAALDTLGKHYAWLRNDISIPTDNNVQVLITLPANGREALPDETKDDDSGEKD